MMLLEHDAKTLLQSAGVHCPEGWLAAADGFKLSERASFPVAVKAQVPVGGRGKAGGIRICHDAAEVKGALTDILGMEIKGHTVGACRIEQAVDGNEHYMALKLVPDRGQVCCLYSRAGGVEIESNADALGSAFAAYEPGAVKAAFETLFSGADELAAKALVASSGSLVDAFFVNELMLLEINPLMIDADGGWTAADAKVVVDLNALPRQDAIRDMIEVRPGTYPEAEVKLKQGFDFVILSEDADIGLITTGAGLSMQVADELAARGHDVFNFCDMRTGGFRGNPDRLIYVLREIAARPTVKATLVNIFAGITHLGEFSAVLLDALKQVPEFKLPIVARLVGNGEEEGMALLSAAPHSMHFERDLDRAMDMVVAISEGRAA